MQCVVLAGGLATRMRPATSETPKWLLPVAGRPFALLQLEWLEANGVDSVVACIGHLGRQIRERVGAGRGSGISIEYSDDGPTLLGTGGALRAASDRGLLDGHFLVLYGDSYLPITIAPVWRAFESDARPALMTVFENNDRLDASNVVYESGVVTRYTKRADRDDADFAYIDYGLSVLDRSVLDALPPGAHSDLAELFESLASRGKLSGFEVTERFYEIGSPQGLHDLERYVATQQGLRA